MTDSQSRPQSRSVRWLSMTLALLAILAMAGCGGGVFVTPIPSSPPAAAHIHGTVYGGQQPVVGATIQLYAINPTTRQGASTPLLTSTVVSDGGGYFDITHKYTCPDGALMYITASGGNAGGGVNPSIGLVSGLGTCSALMASTFISINELTTVATVYSLAPFMKDYAHIGAFVSDLGGITSAFQTINSLVDIATGISPGAGAPVGATIPTAELNTLANIVASCVNSDESTGSCSSLFNLALPSAGTPVPATTADAVLNMAKNPGLNVGMLFLLPIPDSPFQPVLTKAPTDWTVSIRLTGAALSSPYGIAIDANGSAWVTNEGGTSITEFSSTGMALSGGTGYGNGVLLGPQGLSIDPSGNVWVANTGANTVVKLLPNGNVASPGVGYASPGMVAPVDIAADARGNVWVANFLAGSITELNPSGSTLSSLTASATILRPDAIAIDPTGNVWIGNSGEGTLSEFDKNATLLSPGLGFSDNALQAPTGLALDGTGAAWVSGAGGGELSAFGKSGTPLPASPVYGVLTQPTGVAIDGGGNIWVANSASAGFLSEFLQGSGLSNPPSAALGVLNAPVEIAIDESGYVWTANSGDNSVNIFVGLATPTATPLVAHTN